ncbi:MAG: YjbF family lipoprotein [Paracoccus sp. (in: a-proteobacteria)]|uniref:YjbF family lipoprotein n=1 Tax=Paracoccus sp. TaxID=267 RepID=UPI0026DF163D|nr:YjbF family lipoprotein [Paracoccus sp. (in: a-proteobacteria)]MDO5620436.1 YjbF family lipoprotein [Paracoccus sp. (in: a-proteobacteria)]
MTRKYLGAACLAATTLTLAACGNDTERSDTSTVLRQTLGGVAAQAGQMVGGSAAAPATPARSPDQIAAAALQANPGPLILATVESAGNMQAMALIGENGSRRTFATTNQQALVLDQGVLTSTKGLGHDLNATDAQASTALIRARRAGQANRVNYYLTGEGVERALPVSCTITSGEMQAFDFAGRIWSARQMAEHCQGHGADFTNNYLVAGDGSIVLSRQWIGPAMGYVTIQTIRP